MVIQNTVKKEQAVQGEGVERLGLWSCPKIYEAVASIHYEQWQSTMKQRPWEYVIKECPALYGTSGFIIQGLDKK